MPQQDKSHELAKAAYDAYVANSGQKLPQFDQAKPDVQKAWIHAIQASEGGQDPSQSQNPKY
jgi:hypothetical protein